MFVIKSNKGYDADYKRTGTMFTTKLHNAQTYASKESAEACINITKRQFERNKDLYAELKLDTMRVIELVEKAE